MTSNTWFPWSASSVALASAAVMVGCTLCPCPPVSDQAAAADDAKSGAEGGGTVSGTAAYQYKSVAILGGGFVTGVIFSPAEKDLIYARTDIGGAYRYDAKAQHWIPITDMLSRAQSNFKGIESLAADPVNADRVYMAVGTYSQEWAGAGGMMRSKDRGDTWEITEMPIKMGGNENGRGNGERLAVDPNDPNILWFGSRKNGLWKSADAGQSWAAGTFPEKTEELGVGITFVLLDRASGTQGKPTPTIYAGWASTKGGLYRSTNAGADWALVPGQPQGLMPSHADFDKNGTLYISYGNKPGPSEVRDGAIYKYDPKQNQWTKITPLAPKPGDKFGYGGLSVSATNPGTVMVTTIDRWGPGDEIFRTTDGGKTWKALGPKVVRDAAGAKYLYWGRKEKISATGWMADIDIDPFNPARAMYVTGQGIWATEDAAAADTDQPTHWKFLNRGLEETAVNDLASPPSGPPLYSMMGDLGGFRHDDLNEPTPTGMFQNPIFGGGSSIDFAQSKPDVLVRAGSHDQGQFGAYSADGGKTWQPFASSPKGATGSGEIVISADGSTILWAAKDGEPSSSRDQGKTWVRAEGLPGPSKLPDWAPVNCKLAADRVNPQKLYAYDAMAGLAYFSTDGGANFKEADSALPALPDWGLPPASMHTVPGVEGDIWVTTGKELFRSTDSGKRYQSLDNVMESYGVGFGKAPEGKDYPAVYLSAKIDEVDGFYRSDDAGGTWTRINDDQHEYGGTNLIIGDPRVYGRVYIGTHGRGILYGEPQ